MSYDDILGKSNEDDCPVTKDSIIEAQKYNIECKEKVIKDLIRKVTELERHLENMQQIVDAKLENDPFSC